MSYREILRHHTITFTPLRKAGESTWNLADMPNVMAVALKLATEFNVDTNKIYLSGFSDGGRAVIELLEKFPTNFAAAFVSAGVGVTTKPALYRHVPIWVFHAQDDPSVNVSSSRDLVAALRRVGGNPIYSEFAIGGHEGSISATLLTPQLLDWIQSQALNTPTEPQLLIHAPTGAEFTRTGATNVSLAGSALSFNDLIVRVNWENVTQNARGPATGSNEWSTASIPLRADRTNAVIVTATVRPGWAVPFGGATTFSDTISIASTPVRATLTITATGGSLTWTGGVGPFRLQTALQVEAGVWSDLGLNAEPPIPFSLDQNLKFVRIVGN
jgi:hypothetical protein